MNRWATILIAAGLAFAAKFAGYLIPAQWVSGRRTSTATTLLPVALLSALVVVQTFTNGHTLTADSRLLAIAVAGLLLWKHANFLVVLLCAAATAAIARKLGMP